MALTPTLEAGEVPTPGKEGKVGFKVSEGFLHLNRGNETTFMNRRRQEVLDNTICTSEAQTGLENDANAEKSQQKFYGTLVLGPAEHIGI